MLPSTLALPCGGPNLLAGLSRCPLGGDRLAYSAGLAGAKIQIHKSLHFVWHMFALGSPTQSISDIGSDKV
jgi:hypothetical protein